MFCVKCGAKLEDDAKFCTSCGAKVEDVEEVLDSVKKPSENIVKENINAPVETVKPIMASIPEVVSKPKQKSSPIGIIIALLIVLICILGAGVYFGYQ